MPKRQRRNIGVSPAARSATHSPSATKRDLGPLLDFQCRAAGFSVGTPEFHFHPRRKWRFDRAWPSVKFAVEIEGGAWTNGAHVRGKHFKSDIEKYAEAMTLGWRVLRVMPEHVESGQALAWIEAVLPRTADGSRSD